MSYCDEAVIVDYTSGHIDFVFNQGDTVILAFRFIDENATGSSPHDVPFDITGKTVVVTLQTPAGPIVGTLTRDDSSGVVVAEFGQHDTDQLADKTRHTYKVSMTDDHGRKFTPVVGHVIIGGYADECC